MNNIHDKITNILKKNHIVLFLKGNKEIPMCGFSGKVVHILSNFNIDYLDIDVLKSYELREGIKKFGNWPTIPQLYVNSKLIGGCDIIESLYYEKKLGEILKK